MEALAYIFLEEIEDDKILQVLTRKTRKDHHPIFKEREQEGCYNMLVNRHLANDDNKFREFFRLNVAQCNYVVDLIKDDISCNSYNRVLYPITPDEKLAITLRFMATGESFHSLAFLFRTSHCYISNIVQQTLEILCKKLMPIFLPEPSIEQIKKLAEEFENKWNFPNVIGAIDGKHVRITCPAKSGSLYFNYKQFFSMVLLAIVDANYKFIFIDCGSYGKEGDSSILEKSKIGKIIRDGSLFPPSRNLNRSTKILPYVIVGDEAFRLDTHIMKPFSRPAAKADERKAIFNYRLSRARRVSENAFALLGQIFRIFYTPIALKPETTENLIIVACCLHNLLRDAYLETQNKPFYEPRLQQENTRHFVPLARRGGYGSVDGFSVREMFMDYFCCDEGRVPWQVNIVRQI